MVQAMADKLSSGEVADDEVVEFLRKEAEGQSVAHGMGVGFAPNQHQSGKRLFAPYLVRSEGDKPELIFLEDSYDYTDFEHRWLHDPMLDGPKWIEPFFGKATFEVVLLYSVPFYRPGADREKDDPVGVVFADLSVKVLRDLLADVKVDNLAYTFLFSPEGRFVLHPRDEFVIGGKTIFEIAGANADKTLNTLGVRAVRQKPGVIDQIEYYDQETRHRSRVFYMTVPSTHWSLALVFFEDVFEQNNDTLRHRLILLVLSATVSILALCGLILLRFFQDQTVVLGWASVFGSIWLALGIATVWYVANQHPKQPDLKRVRVTDRAALQQRLDEFTRDSEELYQSKPEFIPTGVFVQSIEFLTDTNVKLTGYIWQKYPKTLPEKLRKSFILPESFSPTIEEAYRREEPDYTLVGYYFVATLRQNFDYDLYPFDRQEVWLRLWHQDFEQNVILVPDHEAYKLFNPHALPGVEQDLVLPGWLVESSYYDYRTHDYNSNFGMRDYVGQNDFPELHFNIELRREFLSPFVSKVIPIGVAATMLFFLMVIKSKKEEQSGLFGFTAIDVVLGCAALFFVLVFEHIGMRHALGSARVMYFEYFYFTLYLTMIFLMVNSVLFAWRKKIPILDYQDNIIPKLAFWPALLGVIFTITLKVFY